MNACRLCDTPISAGSTTGLCRVCSRRNRGIVKPRETGNCADCGKKLGRSNQSGYCSPCHTRRLASDPEFQAKRLAGVKRKWNDPAYVAKMKKLAQRMGRNAALDEDLQARRRAWGKYAYANWLGTQEVRAKARSAPTRAAAMHEARMGWCPPEMRDRYRFLMRSKKMKSADARKIVLREWNDKQALRYVDSALDYLRRLAPVKKLENGYRVGFSDVLTPSEVVHRAELRGWEPGRWAA